MRRFAYSTYHRSEQAEAVIRDRKVLFIDNRMTEKVLSMGDCLKVLEEVYQEMGRGYAVAQRSTFHAPRPDERGWYYWRPMPAVATKLGVAAIRIISMAMLDTPGQTRIDWYCATPGKFCGIILLFSTQDAAPLAIMNDGHIQHMRVGGTGGLSAKYMARQDASVLGMYGTAGMAATHAWAIASVRPIKKMKVYSPNPEHRKAFVRDMTRLLGIEVVEMDDPRKVAEGSDILAACTNSWVPVIKGEWLRPGMHVISVLPAELDDEVFRRADRYAYSRTPANVHLFAAPEGQRPPRHTEEDPDTLWLRREKELLATEERVSFSDLALGKALGRVSPREITCFTSQGNAIQFAAVAHRAYQLAKEQRLGRKLPLSWFLQDVRN